MEKQTKILLGVGAIIAAYLIFKPKKVVGQTYMTPNTIEVTPSQSNEDISNSAYRCPSGYKLTPKPMGLKSMLVCEDTSGNIMKACREGESYPRGTNFSMGCSPMLELH